MGDSTEETIAGYTLEELVAALQIGDSEVLQAYLAETAYPDFVEEAQNPPTAGPQPRWRSGNNDPSTDTATHGHITAIALLLFVGDMQSLYGMSGNYGYKLSEWTAIERAAGKPDGNLIYALADHFYDPDTGKAWNGFSNPTARTRADEFYAKAVKAYPTNRANALDNLGRALHFVQDANEPHHAANIIESTSTQHKEFEAYAANHIQDAVDRITNSANASLYNFCRANTPGALVHDAAVKAKGYVWMANQPQCDGWYWASYETLIRATQYSAALLYKFAKEVHMI